MGHVRKEESELVNPELKAVSLLALNNNNKNNRLI